MENKNNSGVAFKNDKKTTEKQPDYKGKAVVDGVEKEIAIWVRESKTGTKYFSLMFSEPFKKSEGGKNESGDLPF
jgi:uncharacterized protein (DUF736 family)